MTISKEEYGTLGTHLTLRISLPRRSAWGWTGRDLGIALDLRWRGRDLHQNIWPTVIYFLLRAGVVHLRGTIRFGAEEILTRVRHLGLEAAYRVSTFSVGGARCSLQEFLSIEVAHLLCSPTLG